MPDDAVTGEEDYTATIITLVGQMWLLHQNEQTQFDNIHEYLHGRRGMPSLPDKADEEVKAIRDHCVLNIMPMVRDAFCDNLSVVGYRRADSEQNAGGWAQWQRNRMDSRQSEIYRDTVNYGFHYVVAHHLGGDRVQFRLRSPRKMIALYVDNDLDEWPQYALETWIDSSRGKPRRKGYFYDDEYRYPLDLGEVQSPIRDESSKTLKINITIRADGIGEPEAHGGVDTDGNAVCPIVRYRNVYDSEDLGGGEIAPLIDAQRTINEVNFDRMIVARFGAFPQKVVSGWEGSDAKKLIASARQVWAFDDEVKIDQLPAASPEPYTKLLESLFQFVVMVAKISPTDVAGHQMVNLSAEALAAVEGKHQRKLQLKRESLGESHEQLLRLAAAMAGDTETAQDVEAEMVWRDTESRSLGIVADAIYKIGDAVSKGLPITPMLPLLPGLTQQMIRAIEKKVSEQGQSQRVTDLVAVARGAAQAATQDDEVAQLAGQTTPTGADAVAV